MNLSRIYQLFTSLDMKYSTDSRNIVSGGLFFALKGDNFNGNEFADEAIDKGAEFAVVDEVLDYKYPGKVVKVSNVLWTFQQLAATHAAHNNAQILAIGGSNGKTTTKEIMHAVLSKKYNTIATRGNLNNHIGVPMTLLEIKEDTEIAIVEMGANRIGEMAQLAKIAKPEFGLLTNIGKEHLEGFGGIDGVIQGEGELYDYLYENKGYTFVNLDDEHLEEMSKRFKRKSTYGIISTEANVKGMPIQFVPNISANINFYGEEIIHVKSSLSGTYNLSNILAAAAIGDFFEVPVNDIKDAIESYESSNNRSQLINTATNTVYCDAYNANPTSMEMAVENFGAFSETNKIVMLGDMFELGEFAESEHKSVLDLLSSQRLEAVYLAGEEFFKHKDKFPDFNFFEDRSGLHEHLSGEKLNEKIILIKGSRGMQMEQLLDVL
jgi:UDP-N-acetylmuramoyl-tripeptide--D-alanyl-D-alanine ligase